MKFTKQTWNGKTDTATIIDFNDGTYGIIYPFGYHDDEYRFKTLKGAIRRMEREGWTQEN